MRKLNIFLIVIFCSLIIAQNPPRELTAISNLNARVQLFWRPPLIRVILTELFYDDGTGGLVDSAQAGDIISVRFTPTHRCSLMAVKFNAWNPWPWVKVVINVYPDNGYGTPNYFSPLLSHPETTVLVTGWQVVDLSAHGLAFSDSEEFHIGIKKIAPVDSYPHFVFADTTPTGRSWMYNHATFSLDSFPGDYHIRALVFYRGSRFLRELPSEKRVFTAESPPTEEAYFMLPTGVDHYVVYRDTVPDTTSMSIVGSSTDTSFTDLTVTNDKPYYYAVKAYHDTTGHDLPGYSCFSNIAYAVPRDSASGYTNMDTLKNDDGIPEGLVSWSIYNGFGAALYPDGVGKLQALLFRVNRTGQFKPQIWTLGDDTMPELLWIDWPAMLSATSTGWRSVNVSSWRTIVVDKPFVATAICGDMYFGLGFDAGVGKRAFDYSGGTWTNIADTAYMIRAVIVYNMNTAYFRLRRGWNLVSTPVYLPNDSIINVFPTSADSFAYRWVYDEESGGFIYERAYTIEPGYGYWVLSLADTMYEISGGLPARSFDIPVHTGWNLIGVPATPSNIPVRNLRTYPSGLLGSYRYVYAYDADDTSYVRVEKLLPGKGYFIFVNGNGVLRIGE